MTNRASWYFGTLALMAQVALLYGCSSSSGGNAGTGGSSAARSGGSSGSATGGVTGSGGVGPSSGGAGAVTGGSGGANSGGAGTTGGVGGPGGTVGGGGQVAANGGGGGAGAVANGGRGGAGGRQGAAGGGGGSSTNGGAGGAVACAGAAKSLHFQDDLAGARTTSMQVLANLGTDVPSGNSARTIEMWLYMEGNESWKSAHSIIEYGGVGRCQAFGIDGGDSGPANPAQFDPFTFSAGGPCAGDNNVTITPAPPRTGWLHLALAYDPAGIGGQATTNFVFTVNGVAQPIPARMQTPTGSLLTMPTVISIGSGQDASSDTGNGFTGKIDELRIWNVGRSAQEIADNYRLILRGDEAGLVAYYHFDEGMGTTPMDSSTRRHNAMFATNGGRPVPTWVDSTDLTLTCKP